MAHTISFLLSSDAASMRRHRVYSGENVSAFVVHCEVSSGEFQELDAESLENGHTIASVWCKNGMAISAAVRRVWPDGSLGPVIGRIHSRMAA